MRIILIIVFLMFLFHGEPDVFDTIVEFTKTTLKHYGS